MSNQEAAPADLHENKKRGISPPSPRSKRIAFFRGWGACLSPKTEMPRCFSKLFVTAKGKIRVEKLAAFFKRQPKSWLVIEAVLLVFAIGFIDYLTGYEVTFFPFYSIPILLMVWNCSTRAAIALSLLSAVICWVADNASGHVYSREWLRIWDMHVRLIFFCLVVYAGTLFRRHRDAASGTIELLKRSRKLEQEIITISEREQQRIGRDLHDGLGQHLVAIGFAADSLKEDLKRESMRGAAAMEQIAHLLHDAVLRARELSRGLSPVDRDLGGLESALERLAFTTSKLTGIPCTFVSSGLVTEPSNTVAVHLFRIAQEAITNAVKHSKARNIIIALDQEEDSGLSLRVNDDGIGFAPDKAHEGMGLNIMRYRARMIGGSLDIQPNQPHGTVISCTHACIQEPEETST